MTDWRPNIERKLFHIHFPPKSLVTFALVKISFICNTVCQKISGKDHFFQVLDIFEHKKDESRGNWLMKKYVVNDKDSMINGWSFWGRLSIRALGAICPTCPQPLSTVIAFCYKFLCVHAHVLAYVHSWVLTCTRACLRPFLRALMHANVHSCALTCIRACLRPFVRPCVHWCVLTSIRAWLCVLLKVAISSVPTYIDHSGYSW